MVQAMLNALEMLGGEVGCRPLPLQAAVSARVFTRAHLSGLGQAPLLLLVLLLVPLQTH
jgi:hypothetical protein